MDQSGHGSDSLESRGAEVVILSGACCNPALGGMDDMARRVIQRAAAEAGVTVRVVVKPMSAALYGGVPGEVVSRLKRDSQAGGLNMPVVIVEGRGVSYGTPDVGRITAALREVAQARPAAR